jgi:RNA polymerase sigma factor (sigma-70 family)
MLVLIHQQAASEQRADRHNELRVIVEAAARGDERAWDALVRRFTPLLRAVVRGYRLAPHDVDDVVQACWLTALDSLDSLRDPRALGGWLVTIARRHALRTYQRGVREVLTDTPVHEPVTATDCLEHELIEAERADVLRDAVQRLSGRQRLVLESLITEPDRSYLELSQGLSVPIGSIGPTRERGIRRLRQDERLASVVAQ